MHGSENVRRHSKYFSFHYLLNCDRCATVQQKPGPWQVRTWKIFFWQDVKHLELHSLLCPSNLETDQSCSDPFDMKSIHTQNSFPPFDMKSIHTQNSYPYFDMRSIHTQNSYPLFDMRSIHTQNSYPLFDMRSIHTQNSYPLFDMRSIHTQNSYPLFDMRSIHTQNSYPSLLPTVLFVLHSFHVCACKSARFNWSIP